MPAPLSIPQTQPRNYAWIWICYTGFLFIEPLFDPSLNIWIATLSIFAIFLTIFVKYIHSTDAGHPTRYWMIAATLLLGLIAFPWNQGASCLFVYTASFLPYTVRSVRRVLWIFAAESFLILGEGWLFRTPHLILHSHLHISMVNAVIAVFLTLVIGIGQIFFAEQKRADCLLQEAQAENVTLAAVAERERIARDLHDVLGHTLSVIVLKAELAGRLLTSDTAPDPQRAIAEIADVERITRSALAEVREAIGGYRARGLAAEIETARRTLDAAGVTLLLDSDAAAVALLTNDHTGVPSIRGPIADGWGTDASSTTALTPTEETALALALREAVTNIVRHARATTCNLRFLNENGTRRLVVEDNGHTPITREGNGLRGMRERIESLGGRLSLESDHGTRLSITLPIPATK